MIIIGWTMRSSQLACYSMPETAGFRQHKGRNSKEQMNGRIQNYNRIKRHDTSGRGAGTPAVLHGTGQIAGKGT